MKNETLTSIASSLRTLADSLEALTTTEHVVQDAETVSFEDVRTVLTAKTRLGYTAEVRELLKKHGADKLSEICPDEYPELLKEAKEIGT